MNRMLTQGTPTRTPGSGLSGCHGGDMLLDSERQQGPRKVSLKDARGAPPTKPMAVAPVCPKPRLSVSAAVEDALRQKEAEEQPSAQAPPSDHRSAAANLWQFPEGVRSLDMAAHGEWSRVSLCEPPPHIKHLLNAAKVNHAGQQPQAAAPPAPDCNKMWAARRSVDMRRSMAGRGIRTGAAERVSGCIRSTARDRDASPRDDYKASLEGSPAELPLGRGSPAEGGLPPRSAIALEKPAKKPSNKKVNFEEGLDALRLSLLDSPTAESAACREAAMPSDARATGSSNEKDLHDLHSIGRTLPRVRVALQK